MRRTIGICTTLALVTTWGVVTHAGSSVADDDSHRDGQVIELVAEQADDVLIDLGEPGFGPGDQLLISDVLQRDGRDVGTNTGTCQLVQVVESQLTFHCVAALQLPRGQITVQGALTVGGDAPLVAAITGGTGAYRTAHGEMAITPVDADTEAYRLTVLR